MQVSIQMIQPPAPVAQATAPVPPARPVDQTVARDNAINQVASNSKGLVQAAKRFALMLAQQNGSVSSTDVLEAMRKAGHPVDSAEKRFMGAVFRKNWKRIGYESTGSHKRPVSVWVLK